MDGIPPAFPSDSEDVAWALQTAEALWKRGERVDAVVWVRRAAQAAGEGEDAKRAATLARYAAELGDWIGAHTITGDSIEPGAGKGESHSSLQAIDALLGDAPAVSRRDAPPESIVLSSRDVEVVSSADFEAGFGAPPAPPPMTSSLSTRRSWPTSNAPSGPPPVAPADTQSSRPQANSESDVMTVSLHAPDVEIIEEGVSSEEFPEEEPTPILRQHVSPVPAAEVPTAAEAHAGMLDPWAEAERARESKSRVEAEKKPLRRFEDEEVVTSARQSVPRLPVPPAEVGADASVPPAPRAPKFPVPRGRAPVMEKVPEEVETTTYRQINPRAPRADRAEPSGARPAPTADAKLPAEPKVVPKGPLGRPMSAKPPLKPSAPAKPPTAPPPEKSVPPALDLLEMVDAVAIEDSVPPPPPPPPPPSPPAPVVEEARSTRQPEASLHPSRAPTPRPPAISLSQTPVPTSDSPTAPPPSSSAHVLMPSGAPTRPHAGQTLLDLGEVEALGDLPDDAREAFALAATMHKISIEEEVSHFALALVVEGKIDVSATIVDAPAVRLEKNAILRSRGTMVPGVALKLVCSSEKALVATWDDAAVEAAFRTCPWVEEDLRAVADRVQAKVGMTMGPLGERFDFSLREHMASKLTVRSLAPGEVLVAEGKPVPIAIVGIGEIVLTKNGARTETLRPGDFVFPTQILGHGAAPATATAGEGGAVVLYGDRAVSQELLMGFPPLLEVLATI